MVRLMASREVSQCYSAFISTFPYLLTAMREYMREYTREYIPQRLRSSHHPIIPPSHHPHHALKAATERISGTSLLCHPPCSRSPAHSHPDGSRSHGAVTFLFNGRHCCTFLMSDLYGYISSNVNKHFIFILVATLLSILYHTHSHSGGITIQISYIYHTLGSVSGIRGNHNTRSCLILRTWTS